MMQSRVALYIANDHLTCVLLHPKTAGGWRVRLRSGAAYLRGNVQQAYATGHMLTIRGKTDATALPTLIQDGLEQLMQAGLTKTKDIALDVELGVSCARVGFFQLDSAVGQQLTEADLQAHGRAWVQYTWGVDSSASIVRVSRVSSGDRYLVTCIDHALVDAIQRVCAETQLQFVSCKPAMIQPLSTLIASEEDSPTTLEILAFAERAGDAGHYPVVECVATCSGKIFSIARVWINPGPMSQLHSNLESVVQRLRLQHHHQGETNLQVLPWPFNASLNAQVSP